MDPLVINQRVTIPAEELHVRTSRAGGPGGQHVNKVESAVELRFDVKDSSALTTTDKARITRELGPRLVGSGRWLVVRARDRRSQKRNLDDARERLATLLRDALRPRKTRRATKPTRGSQRRRLDAKRVRGEVKRQRKRPSDES